MGKAEDWPQMRHRSGMDETSGALQAAAFQVPAGICFDPFFAPSSYAGIFAHAGTGWTEAVNGAWCRWQSDGDQFDERRSLGCVQERADAPVVRGKFAIAMDGQTKEICIGYLAVTHQKSDGNVVVRQRQFVRPELVLRMGEHLAQC